MAFIDETVINVALPSIQHALHATVSGAQWVVESYALFLAALILLGGAADDYYGRRLVFTIGVFLFAAASAWCGFAPDIRHLITARALQGAGGKRLELGRRLPIERANFVDDRGVFYRKQPLIGAHAKKEEIDNRFALALGKSIGRRRGGGKQTAKENTHREVELDGSLEG